MVRRSFWQFSLKQLLIAQAVLCVVIAIMVYCVWRDQLGRELLAACQQRDTKRMTELLERGAPADVTDLVGYNVVFYAANLDDLDLVRLALEKGADPNHAPVECFTALATAINHEEVEIVKVLLAYGADPFANDGTVNGCLTHAQQAKNTEILKLLQAAREK